MEGMRRDYDGSPLVEADAGDDPIAFFHRWFEEASAIDPYMTNAMTLATADADAGPDARIVLLKGIDPSGGFRWFTSRASAKGAQLAAQPRAALLFHWPALDRQVRLRGAVEDLPSAAVDTYFHQRPRVSQIAAACAVQGSLLPDRSTLHRAYDDLAKELGDTAVPVPDHWVGYRLLPVAIEFWQGQPGRLHDRLLYRRGVRGWTRQRLAP